VGCSYRYPLMFEVKPNISSLRHSCLVILSRCLVVVSAVERSTVKKSRVKVTLKLSFSLVVYLNK
jgi:hypothetical protein